jgi:hypothetical protein
MAQMSSLGFLNTFEPAAAPMQRFPTDHPIDTQNLVVNRKIEQLKASKTSFFSIQTFQCPGRLQTLTHTSSRRSRSTTR